ncbi:amphi-Trp domain-containing protein [Kribbella sp. NPDC050470]|uniref:amphi-Trp domain-containing protein n=1 Tax=unclassified Kribbella TaxID=2644121 RepID=UPI0037A8CA40
MDLIEVETKESMSREAAAARLHALADMLAKDNNVEFERGGLRITVRVPDEVHLKVEFELGDDGSELEVELTW